MCGIAGIILPSQTISDRDRTDIEAMTHILHHRGPTHTGYYQNKNCLLGNTRLAITDIDARSNLPIQNTTGDIVIGSNGFVSNFKELKQRYNLAHKYVF
ncbi:MAG: hypothetical protein IPN22_11380 [Bacteroidetes bacterium]|nr:hypothetical protein [Bacteroidota bacterium]